MNKQSLLDSALDHAHDHLLPFAVAVVLFFVLPLCAQLSPGELHKSHQQLEGVTNCTQCHEAGEGLSPAKCLDCHTLLAQRIAAGKGLHAKSGFADCGSCHIEHQGRDFDLVYWPQGMENFSHAETGFELQGAHKKVKCRDCHNPQNIVNRGPLLSAGKDLSRTFLGLQTNCLSCHEDTHRGQLAGNCLNCHDQDKWKPLARFDHSAARFRLSGRHQNVACESCHKTEHDAAGAFIRFRGMPFGDCNSCHRDPHQGRLSGACRTCHSTSGWQVLARNGFDHSSTRFPLTGLHKTLDCKACHKSHSTLSFGTCADCHVDVHRGQLASGTDCSACHTTAGFSPAQFSLDQHRQSDFPLLGAHRAIPCEACHQPLSPSADRGRLRFRFADKTCQGCHNNPHSGLTVSTINSESPNWCSACHTNNSWRDVSFDHTITGFALEGEHARTSCKGCHKNAGNTVAFGGLSQKKNCSSCHEDVHRGQLASANGQTDCARCHAPAGWKNIAFNHNRDSRFKLDGAHIGLECAACHPRQGDGKTLTFKPLDTSCTACHGKERS